MLARVGRRSRTADGNAAHRTVLKAGHEVVGELPTAPERRPLDWNDYSNLLGATFERDVVPTSGTRS